MEDKEKVLKGNERMKKTFTLALEWIRRITLPICRGEETKKEAAAGIGVMGGEGTWKVEKQDGRQWLCRILVLLYV